MNKIIIVDDTEINLTLMRHLVNKLEDCEPLCFQESAQAMEWCRHNDPDLAIVDYMMPSPDGLEFTKLFRALPGKADIPLLMITANDHIEIRYQALECGANDFLTKPIDKTEFLSRARNMLALRSSQKKLADRAAWLDSEVKKATAVKSCSGSRKRRNTATRKPVRTSCAWRIIPGILPEFWACPTTIRICCWKPLPCTI